VAGILLGGVAGIVDALDPLEDGAAALPPAAPPLLAAGVTALGGVAGAPAATCTGAASLVVGLAMSFAETLGVVLAGGALGVLAPRVLQPANTSVASRVIVRLMVLSSTCATPKWARTRCSSTS
jgi:hypothetical protein